ncbi:hypothetical protein MMC29_007757, partial [Sticta canariensis]|nr:hypothetical protein [Sticta canariensis]
MATTPALRFLLPRRRYISRYKPPGIDGPLNVTRKQLELYRYASSKPPPPVTSTPTHITKVFEKPRKYIAASKPPPPPVTSTPTHTPKVFEKPRKYIAPSKPPPPPPPPPPPTPKTAPTHNPNVLETPSKYNRPSHPVRTHPPTPRHFPGPPISPQKAEERKKKKYPNMMPPVGTFMYWFLTNAEVHMYITLGVLFSLAAYTAITTFQRTSPFAELLPPGRLFLAHPISYIHQYWRVFKLHTDQNTLDTAELRRKRDDDVEKRRAYRKAHGTERKQQGPFSWMGLAEDEDDKAAAAAKPDGEAAAAAAAAGTQEASPSEQNEAAAAAATAGGETPQLASASTDGSVEKGG